MAEREIVLEVTLNDWSRTKCVLLSEKRFNMLSSKFVPCFLAHELSVMEKIINQTKNGEILPNCRLNFSRVDLVEVRQDLTELRNRYLQVEDETSEN